MNGKGLRFLFLLFFVTSSLFFISCSDSTVDSNNSNNTQTKPTVTNNANVTPLHTPTPTQTQTSPTPKTSPSPVAQITPSPQSTLNVKTGRSIGIVTKIDLEFGSIELDHEDIPGMMPKMIMEFYVKDKKMLNGLKIGDKVSFVLEDRNGQEQLIELKKF